MRVMALGNAEFNRASVPPQHLAATVRPRVWEASSEHAREHQDGSCCCNATADRLEIKEDRLNLGASNVYILDGPARGGGGGLQ